MAPKTTSITYTTKNFQKVVCWVYQENVSAFSILGLNAMSTKRLTPYECKRRDGKCDCETADASLWSVRKLLIQSIGIRLSQALLLTNTRAQNQTGQAFLSDRMWMVWQTKRSMLAGLCRGPPCYDQHHGDVVYRNVHPFWSQEGLKSILLTPS